MQPQLPPRRLLVLGNPISGGGKGRDLVPRLCAELALRNIDATAYFTQRAGDAMERSRLAESEGWDGIVACGGDGTINEVLNGLANCRLPLGVLPIGTANVLALELGLPRSPAELAELLQRGTHRSLPIATAAGRRFLLFCGAGLDGAVVHRLSAVRKGTLGKHKWLGPILQIAWEWPQYGLTATFDGAESITGLSSVLVTMVRNYGGVVELPAAIEAGSDRLQVLCFRQRSRLAWLWQGLRGICRRMQPGPQLILKSTNCLTISGEAPLQIDGDAGGMAPITVALLPQRLTVFAPSDQNSTVICR